jgi:Fungal Zn(2)-Cys(6) binuclear cluster domain
MSTRICTRKRLAKLPAASAACVPCRRSKVKCSGSIPCERCIKRHIESSCILHQRKERSFKTAVVPVITASSATVTPPPLPPGHPLPRPAAGDGATGATAVGSSVGIDADTVIPCVTPCDLPQYEANSDSNVLSQQQSKANATSYAPSVCVEQAHDYSIPPRADVYGPGIGPGAVQYHDGLVHHSLAHSQQLQQQPHQQHVPITGAGPQQSFWGYQQAHSFGSPSCHMLYKLNHPTASLRHRAIQTSTPIHPQPLTQPQPHRGPTAQTLAAELWSSRISAPEPMANVMNNRSAMRSAHSGNNNSLVYPPQFSGSCITQTRSLRRSPASPVSARHASQGTFIGELSDPSAAVVKVTTPGIDTSESDDTVESHALIFAPQQNKRRSRHPHTFMLYHAPTIRRRIAHLEAAARLLYNNCRSPSWVMTEQQSADISKNYHEGMRAVFNELQAPASMGLDVPRRQRRQNTTVLTDMGHQRADFERFMLGVVCIAIQDSRHEAALARAAHDAMMRRALAATGVLELRKGTLDKLPMCVCAKALYPDYKKGGMWINKRAMEVMRVDPGECPDQMITTATWFDTAISHPVNRGFSSSHVAFSIANSRSDACHYRLWKRRDGTYVAGMHSNRYLFGPAPMNRFYFIYVFFQPLPVQPVDIDAWARRVMIASPSARRHSTHHSDDIGWTAAGTSAKYPGIMHQLIQDHIRLHPGDAETLPPNPTASTQLL